MVIKQLEQTLHGMICIIHIEKPHNKRRVVAEEKQAPVQDSGHDVVPFNSAMHGRWLWREKYIIKGETEDDKLYYLRSKNISSFSRQCKPTTTSYLVEQR